MADNQVKKVEQAKELLTDVAERVKGSGTQVYEKLRDTLVDKEVSERVELLGKALMLRNTLISDVRKAEKPDVETFDIDGKVTATSWTKQRAEDLKKKREQLQRLENAFDAALGENDFQKLKDVVKNQPGGAPKQGASESE